MYTSFRDIDALTSIIKMEEQRRRNEQEVQLRRFQSFVIINALSHVNFE